jgi:hypothetical protein
MYSVRLTVTNGSGCSNNTIKKVEVLSSPVVNAGADQTVYYGYAPSSKATLSAMATGGTGRLNYSWNTGATSSSIIVNPTATTTYTLNVTDIKGCKGSDAVVVNVVDVRCGQKLDKISMCLGSKGATCVNLNLVSGYLTKGYTLGNCAPASTVAASSMNDEVATATASNDVVAEINQEKSIKLLSNPVKGILKLQLNNYQAGRVEIEILNTNGIQVEKRMVDPQSSSIQSFNMVKQPTGVYFVKVVSGTEVKTAKVLVMR